MLALKFNNQNVSNQNHIHFYVMIGDSKTSGGTNLESGGWDAKYNVTTGKNQILFRDNRTTGDQSTLRFELYDPHSGSRQPGYGAMDPDPGLWSVGYDNSFMWYMKENSIRNVGLLKWAVGGSTLMAQGGSMNDWSNGTNEMYRLLVVDYVNLARGVAKNQGFYSGNIQALFVSLGTNDCHTSVWNEANFITALAGTVGLLRNQFGKPSLPIYWQQVRSDLGSHPSGNYTPTNVGQVRAALSAYDAIDSNFHLLDYESSTSTSDGVHEDEDACELIGLDLADLMIVP